MAFFKKQESIQRPLQCPRGHHMISWFYKEDEVFCNLCYQTYMSSECLPADTKNEVTLLAEKWVFLHG
jgi:hypothetical protein